MRNYRIAFFTADWNYELVEKTLHGLEMYVNAHENVSICVFDCFGKDLGNARDMSEYAIYGLADLGQFDGLLVQGSQIVLEPVRRSIQERLAAKGIPAVTIDCPMEGVALISLDNHRAMYDLTTHVIREHGARRLVHLTGILENGCPEGYYRRDGFLDACRDCGIPEADVEVIECTWRTSDGVAVAERWLREGRPLPDAFVSANDEMALGMMEYFSDHGVRVPRDVIVTGFDNVSSAELSSPRLSTVNRDYELLAGEAMKALIDRIEGRDDRAYIPFQHQLVRSESCGCPVTARQGYIRDKYFQQTRFLKTFYMRQDDMAESLLEARDLRELMGIVRGSDSILGCDDVYLCVNDYYFDNYDQKQCDRDSGAFGDEMILATSDGFERFPARQLLPLNVLQRERFLVFYPLHYNTSSIGYIAMNGISEAAKLNLHRSVFNFIEIAIENVRKKGLLRQLNGVLDELYVHDALTELYNRFGFERYARGVYDGFMAEDGAVQLLFIDMDDMKGINDRFGHEAGDAAIRDTAQILKDTCGERAFLMRYGGDEFVVIASGLRTQLEADIQSAVAAHRARGDQPFQLSLSIGIVRVAKSQHRSLDECLITADQQMYAMKKQRKHA